MGNSHHSGESTVVILTMVLQDKQVRNARKEFGGLKSSHSLSKLRKLHKFFLKNCLCCLAIKWSKVWTVSGQPVKMNRKHGVIGCFIDQNRNSAQGLWFKEGLDSLTCFDFPWLLTEVW